MNMEQEETQAMHSSYYYKQIHGKKFALRSNTLDEFVAKETGYDRATYARNDVWLDIGANIGSFPVHYANRVAMIHCFEPENENLEMLRQNLSLNKIDNVELYPIAVVGDDRTTTKFYINQKKNKGSHSTLVKRGRKEVIVPCKNINDVIADIRPNKIKIDIEGGEFELITSVKDWSMIDEIIFEYHIAVLRDAGGVQLSSLYKLLTAAGFSVHGLATDALKKRWYTLIHCVRP